MWIALNKADLEAANLATRDRGHVPKAAGYSQTPGKALQDLRPNRDWSKEPSAFQASPALEAAIAAEPNPHTWPALYIHAGIAHLAAE